MPRRLAPTTALRNVWLWAAIVGLYSLLPVIKERTSWAEVGDVPASLEAVITFAMSVLLAMRVSRCYERWWEARTLWGTLVNTSRNLAVKFRQLSQAEADECGQMRNLIVEFCNVLRVHLREGPGEHHGPSDVSGRIYGLLMKVRREGRLDEEQFWMLDREARILLEVCGGCERIRNTLMPKSFRSLVHHCLLVYLAVLPWGLAEDLGALTVPVSILACYLGVSAECIARYIEEPFGMTEDHLDLEGMCAAIESSVSEALTAEAGAETS